MSSQFSGTTRLSAVFLSEPEERPDGRKLVRQLADILPGYDRQTSADSDRVIAFSALALSSLRPIINCVQPVPHQTSLPQLPLALQP